MSNLIDGLALVVALGSAVVSCLSAGAAKASADAAKISAEETKKQRKISQYVTLSPHFFAVSQILSALSDGKETPKRLLAARDSLVFLKKALPKDEELIAVVNEIEYRFEETISDGITTFRSHLVNYPARETEDNFAQFNLDHNVDKDPTKKRFKIAQLKEMLSMIEGRYISLDDTP